MKEFTSRVRNFTFLLLFIAASSTAFAQNAKSVFGEWSLYKDDGSSIEYNLCKTAKKGNFIYLDKKVSYGGIAVTNEYYEYIAYYTFESFEKQKDNSVKIKYQKEDQFTKKVTTGVVNVTYKNGTIILSGNDKLLNGMKLVPSGTY